MGIAFGTAATVFKNYYIDSYLGVYNEVTYKDIQHLNKPSSFPILKNRNNTTSLEKFKRITGEPIAYWISEKLSNVFQEGNELSTYGDARRGLQTGDSNQFIRSWFELNINKIFLDNKNYDSDTSKKFKWFLFNSGGNYRKWYGNIIEVVDWFNNGEKIKSTGKAIIPSEDKYFKQCITWNKLSSGKFSVRFQRKGIIQGDASPFFIRKIIPISNI